MRIKHILFPADFTDRCCRAIPFVVESGAAPQRRITSFRFLKR